MKFPAGIERQNKFKHGKKEDLRILCSSAIAIIEVGVDEGEER